MPKSAKRDAASLGRIFMKARALYDLYGAFVYAAIYFDGRIKERRRRKRKKPETSAQSERTEHPMTTRLRRELERERRETS